jgi:hypothetical protein
MTRFLSQPATCRKFVSDELPTDVDDRGKVRAFRLSLFIGRDVANSSVYDGLTDCAVPPVNPEDSAFHAIDEQAAFVLRRTRLAQFH